MLVNLLTTLMLLSSFVVAPGAGLPNSRLKNDLVSDNGVYIRLNGDIVQVALNKKALESTESDVILRYGLNDEGVWDKSVVKNINQELYPPRWKYYFLGSVPVGRVPMYTPAITTVYFDPDYGEENLVVLFRSEVGLEFKKEWIKQAVKFIKGYHSHHEERRRLLLRMEKL